MAGQGHKGTGASGVRTGRRNVNDDRDGRSQDLLYCRLGHVGATAGGIEAQNNGFDAIRHRRTFDPLQQARQDRRNCTVVCHDIDNRPGRLGMGVRNESGNCGDQRE